MTAKAKRDLSLDDAPLTKEDLRRAAENQKRLIARGLIKAENVQLPEHCDWPLRDAPPTKLAFTWGQIRKHDKAA